MHVLSFCSGIGGLDLGVRLATGGSARVVCYVEGEAFAASILAARAQEGVLCDAPIYSDVKSFDAQAWRGRVDCITAGFPCQPFSTAGKRKGKDDPRHLWPHIAAHVRVLRPTYVFCENVPGHLSLGFEQVCRELYEMGYGVEAGIFSAAEVGAPHLRKRLFFLAHSSSIDARKQLLCRPRGEALQPIHYGVQRAVADADQFTGRAARATGCALGKSNGRIYAGRTTGVSRPGNGGEDVADADSKGCGQGVAEPSIHGRRHGPDGGCVRSCEDADVAHADHDRQRGKRTEQREAPHAAAAQCGADTCEGPAVSRLDQSFDGPAALLDHLARGWPADWEHGVPRVAENQPHRIDRLRALGNAVVPQTAALAWTTLMQQAIENGHTPL